MIEFDTQEGWENFFEEKFPNGILVTYARGDHELAGVDSSVQELVTKVGVDEFDDISPTLFLSVLATGHPRFFTPLKFITEDPDHMVIEVDKNRYIILSNMVSESQASEVRSRKEGGIFS